MPTLLRQQQQQQQQQRTYLAEDWQGPSGSGSGAAGGLGPGQVHIVLNASPPAGPMPTPEHHFAQSPLGGQGGRAITGGMTMMMHNAPAAAAAPSAPPYPGGSRVPSAGGDVGGRIGFYLPANAGPASSSWLQQQHQDQKMHDLQRQHHPAW